MSFEKAAAIPEVWCTAYQLLHFVGKIQPGETALVLAAASGVGTALL
jgi:tumor protein p53-inducible protein 3